MASLFKIKHSWAVQVLMPDRRRLTIRIGKVQKRTAEADKYHIENLVLRVVHREPLPPATHGWLTGISDRMRERLRRAGLLGIDLVKTEPANKPEARKEQAMSNTFDGVNCIEPDGATLVTPEMAERFLATQKRNRPISKRHVEALARAFARGDGRLIPDGIAFDSTGALIEGQHRLSAIILSGVSVPMFIMRGFPPEAQKTTGRGRKRTISEVLGINGRKNPRDLAAAVSWVWKYENGDCLHTWMANSPEECEETLKRHPGLPGFISEARELYTASQDRVALLTRGVAIAAMYLFDLMNSEKRIAFQEGLVSGAKLSLNDPRRLLRALCIKQKVGRRKLPNADMFAMTIKTWNAFVQGREIKQLVFRRGGKSAEDFPQITG